MMTLRYHRLCHGGLSIVSGADTMPHTPLTIDNPPWLTVIVWWRDDHHYCYIIYYCLSITIMFEDYTFFAICRRHLTERQHGRDSKSGMSWLRSTGWSRLVWRTSRLRTSSCKPRATSSYGSGGKRLSVVQSLTIFACCHIILFSV